jgi:DNA mismatch repair protein MutL
MSNIRILPEILANKIAAGEVVERPASVVKELVENALDAQSTRILIDIEGGGRSLIRVADNGHGMGHDDALLCLERFATSKIRSDRELFSIQTLGFRGEALPSIAAVSKMTLVSRPTAAESGVEIRIEGGKIVQVADAGAPVGTMVSVAQLFFNTPARRKFLKTVNTEMGHIADVTAGLALGHPGVHFRLTHNGKSVKQWPKSGDAAQRAAGVFGQLSAGELIRLDAHHDDLAVSGYLAPARQARKSSRGIYLYVNGRRVRDRMVQHALFEGYGGRLMKGQFPLAVLFIELPFDRVDVNVHPTKHEIRFADQRSVHQAVRNEVAAALTRADRRLWAVETDAGIPNGGEVVADPGTAYGAGDRRRPTPLKKPRSFADQQTPVPDAPADRSTGPDVPVSSAPLASMPTETPPAAEPVEPPEQSALWSDARFARLTVIGQFHGTYIICQSEQGLILIDQHAAHERIVYEALNQGAGRIDSQRLLAPETVELGHAEAQLLEQLAPRLNDMGLELEPFGGNTFVVKAVPAVLDDRDIASLVIEIADRASTVGTAAGLDKILDECRMVMACHNAVRARQRLSREQIAHMLARLDRCDAPSHCPHGRPTWIEWTVKELEKAFKRIAH